MERQRDDDRAEPAGRFAARITELERHRSVGVEARLAEAEALEAEAGDAGEATIAMRARLVLADMLHRVGDSATAFRRAAEVNAWANDRADGALAARSHLVLSSIHEAVGDTAAALDHAIRALSLADADTTERERGNYLLRLADALAGTGSTTEARHRYDEAGKVFRAIGDRERELNVLNNLTMLECEIGDGIAAVAAARQLEVAAGVGDTSPEIADTIARAYLAGGEVERAAHVVQLGRHRLVEHGDEQAATPAELELTDAEVCLALGHLADADAALDRCLAVCDRRGLAALRVSALAVRADVHARRGDFPSAYAAHRAFHDAYVAQRSAQAEAAARALFDTAEARNEAQHFWLQARTDPLTELYNRRYVSEMLPAMLARSFDGAPSLVAALVDVDHFKRVNDDFDHTVGDEVLRRLAALLAASVPAAGSAARSFVARLGGEEFLLVLAGLPPVGAVALLEDVRCRIAGLDWSSVARGVEVTVSIGAAVATAADTQHTLLSRADAHLYEAKAAGRDRVVADAGPAAR